MISRGRLNRGVPKPWHLPFVTEFWDGNSGITVTGAGVSQWDPIKGTHSFTQGTDAARPAYASGVLTFDGSDDYLSTGAFTLNQPCTFFGVAQVTAPTADDRLWDGNVLNRGGLLMKYPASVLQFFEHAGSELGALTAWATSTYYVFSAVYNGASSSLWVNMTANGVGDAGAANPGGLYLGVGGGATATTFFAGAFKCFGYSVTALADSQRGQLVSSLSQRYSVSI